jgi:hypothetical protein
MALWNYADWITYTDLTVRLERLRLHIAETSEKNVGSKTRTGAYFPISPEERKMLYAAEEKLAKRVESSTSPTVTTSFARCRRE